MKEQVWEAKINIIMEDSTTNCRSIGKGTLQSVLRSQGKHFREEGGQTNEVSIAGPEALENIECFENSRRWKCLEIMLGT